MIHLNTRLKDQKNKIFLGPLKPLIMKNFMLSILLMMLSTLAPGQSVPSITTFTPTGGNVSATVTLTGINFDATAGNNIV